MATNLKYLRMAEFKKAVSEGGKPTGIFVRKDYSADITVPAERKIKATISTDAEDRDGDIVSVKGWSLDRYRANPVVLWAHKAEELPVAKALNIGIEKSQRLNKDVLGALSEFPEPGVYQKADWVYGLSKGGFLRGTSVGFNPIEYEKNVKRGGMDFHRQELMEYSFVSIPSNYEALTVAKAAATEQKALGEYIEAMRGLLEDLAGPDLGEVIAKWDAALNFVRKGLTKSVVVPEIKNVGGMTVASDMLPPKKNKKKPEDEPEEIEVEKDDEEEEDEYKKAAVLKYIREENGKYCVYSESGKKLGEHDTKAEALAQLRAIEANKGKDASMDEIIVKGPVGASPKGDNADHRHQFFRESTEKILRCKICGMEADLMDPHKEGDIEVKKEFPPKKKEDEAPPDTGRQAPPPNAGQMMPDGKTMMPNGQQAPGQAPPPGTPPGAAPAQPGAAPPSGDGSPVGAIVGKIQAALGGMDEATLGAAIQVLETWLGQLGVVTQSNQNAAPPDEKGKQRPSGSEVEDDGPQFGKNVPEKPTSKSFVYVEGVSMDTSELAATITEQVREQFNKMAGALPGDK